jgi:RAB protein geranylgeranyltransferase component A
MAANEQDSAVGSDESDYYDTIVIGTGVGESMLAAALSRVGKKVLHIDHNPYYAVEVWLIY